MQICQPALISRLPRTMMEVFRCLPEGTLIELIENNLVLYPTPFLIWHEIRDEIWPELSRYVKQNQLGRITIAPYDVYLDETNAFHPDISFISNQRMSLIREDGLYGAPDIIIEILSDFTAQYDLYDKKNVYERNAVTEYWIVNPGDKSTTGYYLNDGQYHEFFKGTGKIVLKVLDWQIDFNNMEHLQVT